MPRETINACPPPPPLRPQMSGGGILKCACFRLPSRSKTKSPAAPPPLVTTKLIGSAGGRSSSAAKSSSAAPQSPSVTFLASASLSTWWPPSPSSAAGHAAGPHNTGNVVAPGRRASTSAPRNGLPRASSSSFSHWRRSLSSSRRVMPHGGSAAASARASFSFPASPASASSSCMSTPKIPQGNQQ